MWNSTYGIPRSNLNFVCTTNLVDSNINLIACRLKHAKEF